MNTRVSLAVLGAFAFGCASGGGASDLRLAPDYNSDLRPVPVYDSVGDVPCEYEVIRTLHTESRRTVTGTLDYERMRTDVLGGAGASIGADAVIVPDMKQVVPPGSIVLIRNGPLSSFSGEAVRYIPGTCRAAELGPPSTQD